MRVPSVLKRNFTLLLALSTSLFGLAVTCRRRPGTERLEGYFAPVYSTDGRYVYFVERRTSGTVEELEAADLFSPRKVEALVAKDEFSLKRLSAEGGEVEELLRFPPSPIQGRRYQTVGSAFQVPDARLQFTEGGQLRFDLCLTVHHSPRAEEYWLSGVWSRDGSATEPPNAWEQSHCEVSGYDEWPLFGDWELLEVRGGREFFPVAVVSYNHVTNAVKVLIKNRDYDRLYPGGVPLKQIEEASRRQGIERAQTVRRVHEELLRKYLAEGLGEAQALLRVGEEMERLGYYPKRTKIVARRLSREDAAKAELDRQAFFAIGEDEMRTGIFPDIEHAIASPGVEVDKGQTEYLTHRDYSTSARLNSLLASGRARFYVRYSGETYELSIKRP